MQLTTSRTWNMYCWPNPYSLAFVCCAILQQPQILWPNYDQLLTLTGKGTCISHGYLSVFVGSHGRAYKRNLVRSIKQDFFLLCRDLHRKWIFWRWKRILKQRMYATSCVDNVWKDTPFNDVTVSRWPERATSVAVLGVLLTNSCLGIKWAYSHSHRLSRGKTVLGIPL